MVYETDLLVIGSGMAGLWFAYRAGTAHHRVLIVTKKERSESNTNYAQGGIAAAVGPDDSPELHFQDTVRAGEGLSREPVARMVTSSGPGLIEELRRVGVEFSLDHGRYDLGREGGHSKPRIIHAQDSTGFRIEQGLLRRVQELDRVEIWEHCFAYDLWISHGECLGARVVDMKSKEVKSVRARATLLATGGLGQVYLHTTNPLIATGDGIAMAYRARARLANLEFIQFHPTALYGHKIDGRTFLISEAVRGEGGVLRTIKGDRFMPRYHPKGELAPRDVVARASHTELQLSGDPHLLLDLSPIPSHRIKDRFPNIYQTCLRLGLDITQEPIPVVPAAHYACGGVWTDEFGQTSIQRLFAAGECAFTGLHGANRLASNSLLEALVFADRAARCTKGLGPPPNILEEPEAWPVQTSWTDPFGCRERVRRVMWERVGIVRNIPGLEAAQKELSEIERQVAESSPGAIDPYLQEFINLLTAAQLIVRSALMRRESRGLHYLEDYPQRDDIHFRADTIIEP